MLTDCIRYSGVAALVIASLSASLHASDAAQPIVVFSSPASVALALREEGYRAKLIRDDQGRPMIESGAGGVSFELIFYGCDDDRSCLGGLFSTAFDLDGGIGLAEINDWNKDRLIGRAFVDSNCDPFIDHFVVADPMMSKDGFVALMRDWEYALSDFEGFIGFNDDTPRAAVVTCNGASDAI